MMKTGYYKISDTPIPVYKTGQTGSTNADAKLAAANGEGEAIFVAEEQAAGRGRLGRSFFSPGGGVYMSFLLHPRMEPEELPKLTTLAAVATAEAVEEIAGIRTGIKWVNDIYIGEKKAAGILTEGGFDAEGKVRWAVCGIGINALAPEGGFPEELRNIATAVWKEHGDKEALCGAVIRKLWTYYTTGDFSDIHRKYRARSIVPGREILVLRGGESYPALALDIDKENHLLVRYADGREEALSTGEISIRIKQEEIGNEELHQYSSGR